MIKRLALILLVLILLNNVLPNVYASNDEFLAKDKAIHASVSYFIDVTSFQVYKKNSDMSDNEAQIAAFVTAMFIGVIKEILDDKFSFKDLSFDALGAASGGIFNHQF